MSYGFNHEGRSYFPDGRKPRTETADETTARNRATSAAEVAAFKARSADRWFVYAYDRHNLPKLGSDDRFDGELRTWMGNKLADFCWAGPAFECPAFGAFPSRRRNLRARGIDGREWYGTAYLSSGDYARIRVKGGTPR